MLRFALPIALCLLLIAGTGLVGADRGPFSSTTGDRVRPDVAAPDAADMGSRSVTIERVNLHVSGSQPTVHSGTPAISSDGTQVAFSTTVDLASGSPGADGIRAIFARSLASHSTALIGSTSLSTPRYSVRTTGTPALSASGRFVAFQSESSTPSNPPHVGSLVINGTYIFVFDRDFDRNGVLDEPGSGKFNQVMVSAPVSSYTGTLWTCFRPKISGSGRYVVFDSVDSQLVPGDTNAGTNRLGGVDVFIRDRDANGNGIFDETAAGARKNVRVSVASDGSQSNLRSNSQNGDISADGRFVAFVSNAYNLVPGDTNAISDIFVHDRDADANNVFDEPGGILTQRVSIASDGRQASAPCSQPVISGDGRYVAFVSAADTLVDGDHNGCADVFLHDRLTATTIRVSARLDGADANLPSFNPAISGDGHRVVFQSLASNLVPYDANGAVDVFLWQANGTITLVSGNESGTPGNQSSMQPAISADGSVIAFASLADNLVVPDQYFQRDVYVVREVPSASPGLRTEAGAVAPSPAR